MRPGTPGAGGVTLEHDRLDLGGVDLTGLSREDILAALTDAALEAFDELGPADFADRPPLRPVRFMPYRPEAEFAFDPDEPRDEAGKWTAGGAGDPKAERLAARAARSRARDEREQKVREKLGPERIAKIRQIVADLLPRYTHAEVFGRRVKALHLQVPENDLVAEMGRRGFDTGRARAHRLLDAMTFIGELVKSETGADPVGHPGLMHVTYSLPGTPAQYSADPAPWPPADAEFYSPDQPRDDAGEWTTGGGGTKAERSVARVARKREERASARQARGEARHLNGILRDRARDIARAHGLLPDSLPTPALDRAVAALSPAPGVPTPLHGQPLREKLAAFERVRDEAGREIEVTESLNRLVPRREDADALERLREVSHHAARAADHLSHTLWERESRFSADFAGDDPSGHWVTLEEGEHVFIHEGKVYATREAIEHLARGRPPPDTPAPHHPLRPAPGAAAGGRKGKARGAASPGVGGAARPAAGDFDPHAEAQAIHDLVDRHVAAMRTGAETDEGGRGGGLGRKYPRLDEATALATATVEAHVDDLVARAPNAAALRDAVRAYGLTVARGGKAELGKQLRDVLRQRLGTVGRAYASADHELDPSEAHFAPLRPVRFTPYRPDAEFYSPDQPRDDRGRWTTGGGEGAAPRPTQAGRAALRQSSLAAVRAYVRAGGEPTHVEHEQLAAHLARLTVDQLHAVKVEHGLKASGKVKSDLVARLAERFRLHRAKQEPAGRKALAEAVAGREGWHAPRDVMGGHAALHGPTGARVRADSGGTMFDVLTPGSEMHSSHATAGEAVRAAEASGRFGTGNTTAEREHAARQEAIAKSRERAAQARPPTPAAALPAPAGGGLPRQGEPHPEEIKEAAGRVFQYPSSKGWWVRDVDPKVGVLPSPFKTKADAVAYAVSNRRAVESRRGADYAPYDSVSRADVEKHRAHFAEEDSPESRESDSPDFSAAPAPLRPVRFVPLVQPPPGAEFAPGGQEDARR